MGAWHRFRDWPLRAKMAALLAVASLLPMGISTWISTGNARDEFYRSTATALVAQAEKITVRLDESHRGYLRTADRMALIPGAQTLLQATPAAARPLVPTLRSNLQVWPLTDRSIRGAAIIDAGARVVVSTEDGLQGADLSHRSAVRRALAGESVISDVYLDEPAVGGGATVAYLSPVHAGERVVGAAAIWVDAATVTNVMREANGAAGAGSFGILFDGSGIRIAHSFLDDIVFRPGRRLSAAQIAGFVAERRFGDRTRALLEDVREVSWHERLAQPEPGDAQVFRGFAPGNGQWNYVAARRSAMVNWTVYYLMPEAALATTMERLVRQKLLLGAFIMLAALLAGALFAAVMLHPVRRLTEMARAIGAGQAQARVKVDRCDELGELGEAFNGMADRLQLQSEALLRESADQYRKLFQTMSEGFCTIEVLFDEGGQPVDFVYLETNEVFEARSGLRDVVGRRRSEVIPELDDSWIRLYGRVALTGEPVQLEDEVKPLGRHFDIRAYRVGGPDSRRVAVLFNDITDRRRAQVRQQAQLESLSLLHQITRAIGERQDLLSIFQVVVRALEDRLPADFCCICRYEPEQGRLKVASVGEHGRSRAEHMGLTEHEYVPIDENGLSRCVRGSLVHEPDVGVVPFPFPQRLAAGGLRALVAAPLLVESQVFGVLIAARAHGAFTSAECEFLRQLSEHVALAAHQAQLYEALQAAYEDLRQTQQAVLQQERLRALGQMASGIAHDINNAISPISLYADSLIERETGLSQQGRAQLDTIQRAIQDVAATVARMREFYRAREPERDLLPVQLNELLPQVADLTRPRWSTMALQRGLTIRLHTELQPGLPAIRGAANEIREALTNLVFNAVDAMTAGGDLTLRTFTTPAGLVGIEVGDTGIGMDEDARRRCLEPFFTTKGERGTGLGLAMVYGMAQRHGAEVEIASKPGAGTRVRLLFRAESSATGQVDAAPVVVPRGLRILLVDDDPVLLRSLRETLESDGHIVTAAPGGQEGIDLARATLAAGRSFSIAFTDLGMPHVDGREVARVLKSLAPQMPVVMLTGWGQRMVSEGEHPAGVDLVLGKPPKLRDLREALARFC